MGLLLNVAAGGSAHLRAVAGSRRHGVRRSSSPPAGRRGTSCRRWRWPTRCGLSGARGRLRRRRARRGELVPAAGYELRPIAVEGLSRRNPLQAARAALQARRGRCRGAARSCASCAPTRSWAAAATSPGRSGWPPWRCASRSCSTEADSHLGLDQPRCSRRFARRVCLAFPIAGRDGERYRVTGRPVPPPATDRAAARARFGIGRGRDAACSCSAARSARARSTRRRSQALADAPLPRAARLRARATSPRCAAARPAPPATTTCASTSPRSARRCSPATSSSRAPAARSSRSPPTAGRRSSCPTRTPPPTTRRANARWMAEAGAAMVVADAELTPARLAREVGALLATPRAWTRWVAPRRRSRGRTPLADRRGGARRGALSASRRRRAR